MASRRTLGGGRVIGSSRQSSPAALAQQKHNASLLSPSPSSVSLSTQVSDSQTSTEAQGVSSNVSVGHFDNGATAAASSRMVCPICNEEMVGKATVTLVIATSLRLLR